ncbi:MAG TPA: carbohydrate ABC transporter permease [Thermomicrobiales bacterium]|jgi:glucose/mannose transport system permease protein|nr:carbohydrate ABC transporter permease [Thermomicrobiales bacterium]
MAVADPFAGSTSSVPPQKRGWHAGGIARTVFLVVMALFYLLPIYVVVITSVKQVADVSTSTMWRLPTDISWASYTQAWDSLSPNLTQSIRLVIPATILSALFGALNGYLLAKWKFRGSDVLFTVILFGMFIPYQSILIPLIRFLQEIGLYNSIAGLILVHVVYGLPITTLIFRNFFSAIPGELIEAARVDGAGLLGIFFRIMLPLSVPAFVVVGIFQFTNIWNEFLFGLTIITNPAQQPITVALNNLSGSFSVDWSAVMAGSVLAALPTAVIYILLGRYFIRGMLAGSMKG